MKRNLLDDEFYDKEISDFLESYVVEETSEEKMNETIDVLKEYMPKEKERYPILNVIRIQLSFIGRGHIAISLILILLGILIIKNSQISTYRVLSFITPIPSIIGFITMYMSKRKRVWELEKSFKYSYSLVALSRAVIILIISSFINVIFTMVLCKVDGGVFLKCLTSWIVPMSIISSLELVVFNKVPTIYTSICMPLVWIGILNTFYDKITVFIERTSNITLFFAVILSVAVCMGALLKFYKNEKSYEGGIIWS